MDWPILLSSLARLVVLVFLAREELRRSHKIEEMRFACSMFGTIDRPKSDVKSRFDTPHIMNAYT
jgi:hypothetical protein